MPVKVGFDRCQTTLEKGNLVQRANPRAVAPLFDSTLPGHDVILLHSPFQKDLPSLASAARWDQRLSQLPDFE
jgi:hypothetical protein